MQPNSLSIFLMRVIGEFGNPVQIYRRKLSPEQQKRYDELFKRNSFNQYASDMISVHRRLPDIRNPRYPHIGHGNFKIKLCSQRTRVSLQVERLSIKKDNSHRNKILHFTCVEPKFFFQNGVRRLFEFVRRGSEHIFGNFKIQILKI